MNFLLKYFLKFIESFKNFMEINIKAIMELWKKKKTYQEPVYTRPTPLTPNDENIGNYRYIGNLILRIYRIYRRNIDGYFGKNFNR